MAYKNRDERSTLKKNQFDKNSQGLHTEWRKCLKKITKITTAENFLSGQKKWKIQEKNNTLLPAWWIKQFTPISINDGSTVCSTISIISTVCLAILALFVDCLTKLNSLKIRSHWKELERQRFSQINIHFISVLFKIMESRGNSLMAFLCLFELKLVSWLCFCSLLKIFPKLFSQNQIQIYEAEIRAKGKAYFSTHHGAAQLNSGDTVQLNALYADKLALKNEDPVIFFIYLR